MADVFIVVARCVAAFAFGWAGIAKIARPNRWRVDLRAYRLSRPVRAVGLLILPWVELGIAAGFLFGASRPAAWAALALIATFSIVIVRARWITGTTRLACGCFGGTSTRDYRLLLVRNAALAALVVVGMLGDQEPLVGSAAMAGTRMLPAALTLLAAFALGWALFQATVYRRSGGHDRASS